MLTANVRVPPPVNEPIKGYAPGSPERVELKATLSRMAATQVEIPLLVGGRELRTGQTRTVSMPHRHQHTLATLHEASDAHVDLAIRSALAAKRGWAETPLHQRAAIFLRAAELLATKHRAAINAATMLGQSKTAHQAEIDSACEAVDFLRFNVAFAQAIADQQPLSAPGTWNQLDYRPLDGFVFAVAPFNFTAIAVNLATAPALMGNVVVFKPAEAASLSAWVFMQVLREAGLPDGVINFLPGPGAKLGPAVVAHPDLGGVHFTGSTAVFNGLWRQVGEHVSRYRQYPRLVGETGGKDFIFVHASASDDLDAVAVAIVRGGFEYQGQKCSAASRVFVPESLWPGLKPRLIALVEDLAMGDVSDFRNFLGAVIDERAFVRISKYLALGSGSDAGATTLVGGSADRETGWFVRPTLIETENPRHRLMTEEIFGPVVTLCRYPDSRYVEALRECDAAAPYALTGAVFARDREAIAVASAELRHAAGNFYVNDKPTGAVVGQQPFGGSRGSGTNDKAGSLLNLFRWTSPRTIKETFVPPVRVDYPSMATE
jgi:1-pyrroline-5-carboxylate dehydrogenase